MALPAVGDLYCDDPVDCCTPGSLSLASIDDPSAPAEGAETELVARYEAAIAIAHQRLGRHVCMARYAGGCTLRVSVCVESASCHCPNPCGVGDCDRTTVLLDNMDQQVAPGRVDSATINGDTIAINDDPAEDGGWMLTTGRQWLLSGPLVETGGTFEIVFVLKDPKVEWLEAVKSLACTLVPGTHDETCERVNPEFAPPPGFLNNTIADTLNTSCVMPDLRFGTYGSSIRWVRWDTTVAA